MLRNFFFLALLGAPAWSTPHCRAELLSATDTVVPGQTLRLALLLKPEPGWHIFWSNPGQTGKATVLHWELPPGFQSGPIRWPLPQRLVAGSSVSYGYTQDTIHEVDVKVPAGLAKGSNLTFKVKAEWVVADGNGCEPERADLTVTLPVTADSAVSQDVTYFNAAAWPEILTPPLECYRKGDEIVLRAPFAQAVFLPDQAHVIEDGAPQPLVAQELHLKAVGSPARLQGLLLVGERKGYKIDLPIRVSK